MFKNPGIISVNKYTPNKTSLPGNSILENPYADNDEINTAMTTVIDVFMTLFFNAVRKLCCVKTYVYAEKSRLVGNIFGGYGRT